MAPSGAVLTSGVFPQYRTNRADFRPISLTSIILKILESIERYRLLQYLIKEKLITSAQHGFIPKRSFTSNLLETMDFITVAHTKWLHLTPHILWLNAAERSDLWKKYLHHFKPLGANWFNVVLIKIFISATLRHLKPHSATYYDVICD